MKEAITKLVCGNDKEKLERENSALKKEIEYLKKDIENIKYFKDSSSLKLKLCPVAPYKTNKNNPTPTRQVAYK